MARARSTMRDSRLVSTLSVTPMAEMRNIGVSATWIRCAMSTDCVVTRSLSRPLHPIVIPGREDHQPEADSIPGENLEIVAADIANQGAHGKSRTHERCDRADADHRQIVECQRVPRLEQLQYRGSENGRDRQKEGEFGGRGAGAAPSKTTHAGGARARDRK